MTVRVILLSLALLLAGCASPSVTAWPRVEWGPHLQLDPSPAVTNVVIWPDAPGPSPVIKP